ncbi:MAG TPA: hypothetical protein VLQ91_22350 [Draconibacterium sp.]|nr:hypothetical protein [Draconibacterium sp.]
MTIEKINIDDCFNITSSPRLWERFRPTDGPVYDPTTFEQITYRCSDCNYQIAFKDKDFQKHSHTDFTNLTKTESLLLDNFVMTNELEQKSFLDFYCPTCNKPTRIYFSDGYGGKHGDYIVGIDFGLTIKKDE